MNKPHRVTCYACLEPMASDYTRYTEIGTNNVKHVCDGCLSEAENFRTGDYVVLCNNGCEGETVTESGNCCRCQVKENLIEMHNNADASFDDGSPVLTDRGIIVEVAVNV